MKRRGSTDDAQEEAPCPSSKKTLAKQLDEKLRECPYLGTINRHVLDFDFEKVCCVSLSNLHVYACLVCGRYFQGRGVGSRAYFHSMEDDHHVFINLSSLKVYCLPDNYLVTDPSLDDIKYVISPTYPPGYKITGTQVSFDLSRKEYLPGYVGLNNIKKSSYINVFVQALAHVPPIRDFFLLNHQLQGRSELVQRFGLLVRKIWNPQAFKSHISPHEFVQEVVNASRKRFLLTSTGDSAECLSWLLNTLHRDMTSKESKAFQGAVEVTTHKTPTSTTDDETLSETTVKVVPYLFLTLDLPPIPIFTDELEKNLVPQVPLSTLLTKFDGQTVAQLPTEERTYRIVRVPPYLIMSMKRFESAELKNHTVVNFPLKSLDVVISNDSNGRSLTHHYYDLIVNFVHEGKALDGEYKSQLRRNEDEWIQVRDLEVETVMAHTVALSEAYIQVWQHKKKVSNAP